MSDNDSTRSMSTVSDETQTRDSDFGYGSGQLFRSAGSKVASVSSAAAAKAKNVVDSASDRVDSLTGAEPRVATSGSSARSGAPIRRTRKARLRIARLDPWSVMKTVFLFSVAFAIIQFVATWVIWGVIEASGAFDSVNQTINDLVNSPSNPNSFQLQSWVNTHRVLGAVAVLGVVDVLLITALATLFAFLYNLAATVLGGLEVTLAED